MLDDKALHVCVLADKEEHGLPGELTSDDEKALIQRLVTGAPHGNMVIRYCQICEFADIVTCVKTHKLHVLLIMCNGRKKEWGSV